MGVVFLASHMRDKKVYTELQKGINSEWSILIHRTFLFVKLTQNAT